MEHRFIEEYANFKKRKNEQYFKMFGNELLKEYNEIIEKAVKNVRRGLITVDECMKLISEH